MGALGPIGDDGAGNRWYGARRRPAMLRDESAGAWSVDGVLRILFDPCGYYQRLERVCSVSAAGSFATIHAGITIGVAYSALALTAPQRAFSWTGPEIVRLLGQGAMVGGIGALMALMTALVVAVALHLVALALRGNGGFAATFAAGAYAITPVTLLGAGGLSICAAVPEVRALEPWVLLSGGLWSCGLLGYGFRRLHRVPGAGAFGLALITAALCVVWARGSCDRGRSGQWLSPRCSFRVIPMEIGKLTERAAGSRLIWRSDPG